MEFNKFYAKRTKTSMEYVGLRRKDEWTHKIKNKNFFIMRIFRKIKMSRHSRK
jgi:hypothetical protein